MKPYNLRLITLAKEKLRKQNPCVRREMGGELNIRSTQKTVSQKFSNNHRFHNQVV